jgi:lysophospholipase L1-like esterase
MLGDLQQKFPAARIVIVPPIHRKLLHGVQVTDDNFNDLGYTLQDYVDATKLVAEEYACPVIDLWSTMGITPRVNMTDYFPDGLHPNAIGHMLMARVMEKALNNLNFDGTDTREGTQKIQMPAAKAIELGKVYQYIGVTDANYTNGYFYKCVSD